MAPGRAREVKSRRPQRARAGVQAVPRRNPHPARRPVRIAPRRRTRTLSRALPPGGRQPQAPPSSVPSVDAQGLAWGESPVDVPIEDAMAARDGLGWASGVLALSSALLLLFNSFAIDKWARELTIDRVTGPIQGYSLSWHERLHRYHFDAPVVGGRAAWRRLKALRWPGQPGGSAAPTDPASRPASVDGGGRL